MGDRFKVFGELDLTSLDNLQKSLTGVPAADEFVIRGRVLYSDKDARGEIPMGTCKNQAVDALTNSELIQPGRPIFFPIPPDGAIFRPYLTRTRTQDGSDKGPLQGVPGISLVSLEELENRSWPHKGIKPWRSTHSRSVFIFPPSA